MTTPTQPDGYTLGNPDSYEPYLSEMGPAACKAKGGAWFPTREAAEAALEDGHLPRCWFPEYAPIPGRVYALYDSQPDDTTDEKGAARLLAPARLGRA